MTGDAAKAGAIFGRFLRPFPQPPDRLMRYATLLQKQNKNFEAIEQFSAAAEIFHQHHRDIEALACCESIALLDPENPVRHAELGSLAEELRHADLAARSFLRAGQLTLASGGPGFSSRILRPRASAHPRGPHLRFAFRRSEAAQG